MKKMPCLFEREFHGKSSFTLLQTVTPGCEWVLAGEGIATRKRDGTACLVQDGRLYRRYDAKKGKTPPADAIPCDPAPDPVTGHWPHWVPVGEEPESKWHRAAWQQCFGAFLAYAGFVPSGTYELCGPHFSPAEGLEHDQFFRHGEELIELPDRSWESIRDVLSTLVIERRAKIRRDDYGLPWKPGRR